MATRVQDSKLLKQTIPSKQKEGHKSKCGLAECCSPMFTINHLGVVWNQNLAFIVRKSECKRAIKLLNNSGLITL